MEKTSPWIPSLSDVLWLFSTMQKLNYPFHVQEGGAYSCLIRFEKKKRKEKNLNTFITKKMMEEDRADGRSPNQLRPLACSRNVLNRAHGSARWSQGEFNTSKFMLPFITLSLFLLLKMNSYLYFVILLFLLLLFVLLWLGKFPVKIGVFEECDFIIGGFRGKVRTSGSKSPMEQNLLLEMKPTSLNSKAQMYHYHWSLIPSIHCWLLSNTFPQNPICSCCHILVTLPMRMSFFTASFKAFIGLPLL